MFLNNQKGIAMFSVLMIMTVTTLLGTAVWFASSRETLATELDENQTQAYHFARSGVEAAIGLIDSGNINDYLVTANDVKQVTFYGDLGSLKDIAINDYSIKYTITELEPESNYKIESEGRVGGEDGVQALSDLAMRYELGEEFGGGVPDLVDMTLFSEKSISMVGNAKITGDVITNSIDRESVELTGNAKINDTLSIGPGGIPGNVVRINENAKVGTIDNLVVPRNYPMPEFPVFPEFSGFPQSISVSGNSSKTINPDDTSWYSKIKTAGNGTLTIDVSEGDRVIKVGELEVGGNNGVKLQGSGRLIIYVEDEFTMKGNSSVNAGSNYNTVVMYFKGNILDFAGNTEFVGSLFAKQSNFEIKGNGGVTGHIITGGNKIKVTGNADANTRVLYAPNALLDMTGNGIIQGTAIVSNFTAVGNAEVYYDNSIDLEFFQMLDWGETTGNRTYLN
ncbi:MAG: hypothetical protein FH756_09925 [Firmicutes bacterium]|nr:hypothetical protein [Bacillota bacterium]